MKFPLKRGDMISKLVVWTDGSDKIILNEFVSSFFLSVRDE